MTDQRMAAAPSAGGWLARLGASVRDYFGRRRGREPIVDAAGLRRFLDTRSSFVAQMSLYGYLRTRAGMRYPELFQDDGFVAAINTAKWQLWLACLSDLSVYAGGLLASRAPAAAPRVGAMMHETVAAILAETGVPADAGPDFAEAAQRVLARIALTDWAAIADDASCFTESPPALVRWAPVIDDLKKLDEPIVLNSVRFRWQEVRRQFRQSLDAEAVLRA